MDADDRRLAEASRALRREQRLRQVDALGTRRTRGLVIRLEAGDIGGLRVADVRDHFARLGASLRLSVWWNGADLDRLLDRRHARLVERAVAHIVDHAWTPASEVTFANYGERGSIDILALHQPTGGLLVVEVKSEWGSIEETNRRLDVKVRLAPKIAVERFGRRPAFVARVLVLPEDATARRIARRHEHTLRAAYPARNRELLRWLKRPSGPTSALWFLSEVAQTRPQRPRDGR